MIKDTDRSVAQADVVREKTERAAKKALEEAGGNVERAAEIFVAENFQSEEMIAHALTPFLEAVLKDRPDLEDDNEALVEEAVRRLKALSAARKLRKKAIG